MLPSPANLLYDEGEPHLPFVSQHSVGLQLRQEQQATGEEPPQSSSAETLHQPQEGRGDIPHLQEAHHVSVDQNLQKEWRGEGSGDDRRGGTREQGATERVDSGERGREIPAVSDVIEGRADDSSSMSRQWWYASRPRSPGSRTTHTGNSTGRWLTPEFLFYYVYVAYFYYLFFSQSIELSNQFAAIPALRPWLRGLKPGWLWGRQLDLTDHQWRTFRESLPLLAPAMFLFAGLGRWALPWCATALTRSLRLRPPSLGRLTLTYWFLVSGSFVLYLHGLATVFPAAFAGLNYALVQRLKGHRRFLGILWAYHCASFLAIRACDGFPFAALEAPLMLLLTSVAPAVSLVLPQWAPGVVHAGGAGVQPLVHRWLAWADSHRGALRWHICYNLLLLRMISYACDQHWEHLGRAPGAPAGTKGAPGQGEGVSPSSGSGVPAAEGLVHRSSGGGETLNVGSSSPQQGEGKERLLPRSSIGTPLAHPPSPVDEALGMLYAVHLFFAPLYVAGPIIPYHAFVAQVRGLDGIPLHAKDTRNTRSSSSSKDGVSHSEATSIGNNSTAAGASTGSSGASRLTPPLGAVPASPQDPPPPCRPEAVAPRALLVYLGRTLLALGCLEALLHWCYFPALAGSQLWRHMTPAQLCLLSYGTLNFVWLKFLAIWRLSRLWALLAGFDPPENILRCVSNNYSVQGFWRGWHASYNRWIVRYLYVPLGGARYKALNAWVVFTFVALWHDLEWKLLAWAWIMCLLLLPELLLSWAATQPPLKEWQGTALFREATAVLGALNIMGLMLANLVGFVVGPSGAAEFAARLLAPEARPLMLYLIVTLYVGVKLMLEVREMEARKEKRGHQGTILGEEATRGGRQHVVEKREHQS